MLQKLYYSLADWWPLLSAPAEYEEEAAIYAMQLAQAGDRPARTLLELGSGGGNNASYLKQDFRMTLVDLSSGMLAQSRKLNPECEHHQGDMRTIRLDRQFDRVFIHDAICYMTTLEDLRLVAETAFFHCRPGGAALFAPDYVRETFQPATDHGGHDGSRRSLRYLEWTWDPDSADCTYLVDYVYVLRDLDGSIRLEHDRHVEGLFHRAEWLGVLRDVGFEPQISTLEHSEVERPLEVFVGRRPSNL
ncbi:MAG: class I SAM-dependent methyltransferase [Acidobacteriota bacterium]|nr:class I SAM-dependent methyltransferase [Acidobacteriota bacterium]MDQ2843422.1 class I SAM-dependent methyltransferase [Acidobacteriota bacterium]